MLSLIHRPAVAACVGLIATCGLVSAAQAATVSYSDKASFLAAAGNVTVEDFNSQTDGAQFGSAALDVGPFSLEITGTPFRGRNYMDAPPAQFSVFDVDGTTVANVLTTSDDSLVFTFDQAITSFGADFASLNDGVMRTNILAAGSTFAPEVTRSSEVRFFGFTSDTAFTTVEIKGVINDGYGIDNVHFSVVPVPAAVWLFASGLLMLLRFGRSKATGVAEVPA